MRWAAHVTLGLEDPQAGEGQQAESRVEQVARLPRREELVVEAHEALELKASVSPLERPSPGSLSQAQGVRRGHQVAEAREVEADTAESPRPGVLEGGDDQRLGEAVWLVAEPTHRVQGQPAAVAGKAQKGLQLTAGPRPRT